MKAPFLVSPSLLTLNASVVSPNDGEDNKFGFVDIGGLVTVPISRVASRFGSWNVHFGADYYHLGSTTHSFNKDVDDNTSPSKFVGLVGIGVSY